VFILFLGIISCHTHVVLFIKNNYIWSSEFLSALCIVGTSASNARCRWWHLMVFLMQIKLKFQSLHITLNI